MHSLDELKAQAKRLRGTLEAQGNPVSHSASLELIAKQLGFRDWNTLYASVGSRAFSGSGPVPVALGDRVRGTYLGQPFDGEVIGVQSLSQGRMRVTLEFDDPVDVVTFDSFSSFRKRVSATIGEDGRSPEKTSDGAPQLTLDLAG